MFLIEYRKGQFINGETLQWVSLEGGVKFSGVGDAECVFTVAPEYEGTFLNHLQALNDNITDIKSRYSKIKGEE